MEEKETPSRDETTSIQPPPTNFPTPIPETNSSTGVQDVQEGESPAKNDDEPQYLGPRALTFFMSAILLVVIILTLDQSILATATPKITDQFHTIADIGWYAAAYMICNASLQPLTGKVYTYFPLRYAFLGFVFVFELGSLVCGVAQSSTMLIVGRAVAGMGASGLQNGALTMIAVAAPPSQRPTLMGVVMAMAGAGQLLGPLIGGALTQHATWRWCFYLNLPIGGIVLVVMACIELPEYKNRKASWTFRDVIRDFDITGFTIFAPACIMLLLALEWGGSTYPWSSARIIGLFVGSAGAFVAFFIWEYWHGENAMIPLPLMSMRVVYSSMLASFFQFGGLLIFSYYLPLWFQVIKHASPTMSAVYILPTFISQIISAILTGVLISRIGYVAPPAVVGSGLAALSSGLMSTFNLNTGTGVWIGYQIINGAGRGMAITQPIQAVQSVVKPDMVPTITALIAWAQTFGGAIFIGLAQTAFINLLKSSLNNHAPGVEASAVIATGATDYLAHLAAQGDMKTRHGVLLAYNEAITETFYLALGCTLAAAVACVGIWKTRVERKKKPVKNDVERQGEVSKTENGGDLTKEENSRCGSNSSHKSARPSNELDEGVDADVSKGTER
ncbi:hypothetical protein PV08_04050 [Exophiala spinifera]|uniref:Major facilitator superfamily (MFS) profile domain-containing protein n=1 Tax=Exophiala spinifera TaxID=91928 RepID=A0A0D2BE39_9EURO|nr:uncharacterized protein PV08_04050 [Exophiala spinifera]KIW16860.1 hypothetical protein PV08_04050 [Exophiala spinifera]